jgi:hypothetical protein
MLVSGYQMPEITGNRQLATGKRNSFLKVSSFFGKEGTTIFRNIFKLQAGLLIACCLLQLDSR